MIALLLKGQDGAHVDMVESNNKKAAFLRDSVMRFELPASVHACRIEQAAGRVATPQIVTARALAALDPLLGLAGGVEIDGWRDWQGTRGEWHLDIDEVEVRGQDPVPQSGQYALTTPENKLVTLAFERLDEDTITVTLTSARRERVFEVTAAGDVDG